jgi:hypothetical protein
MDLPVGEADYSEPRATAPEVSFQESLIALSASADLSADQRFVMSTAKTWKILRKAKSLHLWLNRGMKSAECGIEVFRGLFSPDEMIPFRRGEPHDSITFKHRRNNSI